MTSGRPSGWTAEELLSVLRQFAGPDAFQGAWQLQPWTQGDGYSSAQIWRVQPPRVGPLAAAPVSPISGQAWCLRAWPLDAVNGERLDWLHRQVFRVAPACPFLLPPLRTLDGVATWKVWRGRLWQVEPWASGRNDYLSCPDPERLATVMHALATLHQGWLGPPAAGRRGVSPGLNRRLEQWEELRRHAAYWLAIAQERLESLVDRSSEPIAVSGQVPGAEVADRPAEIERWRALLQRVERAWRERDRSGQAELLAAAQQPLPLGTVLADVWSDHLFFEDRRLVAIIDYGGLRTDSVAADLSRCLSSLCGQDAVTREWALEAYEQHRGLTAAERVALWAFDRSSQVLGPIHWVRWLFVDQRVRVEPRIRQRMERIVAGQPF